MILKHLIATLFRALAFSLALAVLLPSILKLSHTFSHHEHSVCDSDNTHQTHFHELDLDCDFYKFNLTKIQFFDTVTYDIHNYETFSKLEISYYNSLPSYQQLTQFLRGPPRLMS